MRRAALALACSAIWAGDAAAIDCKAALALGIDVSSSVDAREYALQVAGLAEAFRDPAVIDALLYPPGSGALVALYAWSGFQHQELLIDWTWLGDPASVADFADRIAAAPRRYDHWPTAVGRALSYGAALHKRAPIGCDRRLIDLSGDGANNDGLDPDWFRSRGEFDGLVINGLAIIGADPDPARYYAAQVLHGPGAFLEIADGYADYQRAILRKLLRELQPPFAADAP